MAITRDLGVINELFSCNLRPACDQVLGINLDVAIANDLSVYDQHINRYFSPCRLSCYMSKRGWVRRPRFIHGHSQGQPAGVQPPKGHGWDTHIYLFAPHYNTLPGERPNYMYP